MDILQCLTQLVRIERGISISQPVAMRVKKAYPFAPPASSTIEHPAFTNDWTLTSYDRPPGQWRLQSYAIHTQFHVLDADQSRGAEIATAFWVAFLDALDKDPNLAGTCTHAVPRGSDPTLALIPRGDKTYQGLDFFIDVNMREGKSFP